jgi:hypothetical protein
MQMVAIGHINSGNIYYCLLEFVTYEPSPHQIKAFNPAEMRKKELDSLQIVIFVKKEKTCLQCI